MSEKKGKDQVLGVAPSGYIHPDNARRLLDGETVAFRKKPYSHDGGGIPVYVGTQPVSADPVGEVRHYQYSGVARTGFSQEAVLNDDAPVVPHGTKLFIAPVTAQAYDIDRAVEAFQIAEHKCQERLAAAGVIDAPEIGVKEGLLAATRFLAAQAQPMKVTSHETIDWTEISKRGLLERINREIMHPLGLAVYRCVETGVSGGALVSPDGVWTYEDDSDQAKQVDKSTEMQRNSVDKPLDLQGHASVIFAKAIAWADARVEAALIQEQGKPHGQACDEAAQTHYELVLALRNLQAVQQPVSGADELTAFEASGLTHNLRRNDTPGLNHTYADAFTEELWSAWKARAALAQQDATLHAEVMDMVRMLEANEWADHCGQSELGKRLEWAITELQNRIAELTKSSSQQDADKVDAERMRKAIKDWFDLKEKISKSGRPPHADYWHRSIFDAENELRKSAIDAARKESGQ